MDFLKSFAALISRFRIRTGSAWSSTVPTASLARLDPRRSRSLQVAIPTVGVVLYSLAVLWFVATTGGVGIRCIFGPKIKEVSPDYVWSAEPQPVRDDLRGARPPEGQWSRVPPRASKDGDILQMLGGQAIENYTDYIQASRRLQHRLGEFVEVRWLGREGPKYGHVMVQSPPLGTYLWSTVFWFFQEMVIFAIGAGVFWKRPNDDSAKVFFALCVVTVVAFMGGYHWSQIAGNPPLIYLFAGFVVFVPMVSLHFYLIFPRLNPIFALYRRRVLAALYGVPALTAVGLWTTMLWSRWGQDGREVETALTLLKWLALSYVGLSAVVFLLCFACLIHSYRKARRRSERNQVRWILVATILSFPPIIWLLWDASIDPARLGMSRSAWPMYIVSLLYTFAYAFSITRYKLMRAEEILNRGVIYVVVSVTAGLLYSGGLVISALIIGERLLDNQTSLGTVVACVTAIVLLILSGAARQRFQSAIDRRFHREKYKFDQAMRKMSLAVGSLVDRETLGRRLLEAAGEVLHVEWGAIYLSDPATGELALAACRGPEPDDRTLRPDNPLVERFRQRPSTLRVPHAMSLVSTSDPATDAMIALGGELATPLEADDNLAGMLVLGPKRSGMPYEDEEVAFLGALGSVATLALRSADIQHTLESLNQELREKVDKIAEQQRRILILQDQLAGRSDAVDASAALEGPLALADPEVFSTIKGSSRAVRQTLEIARKVAVSPSAVLIRGESGTGKELLAEAIHAASPRAGKPFVKVHCAALSQGLLESELFGHVKGAFTDAKTDRVGRFQQADGGTLFLDEIGDINLEVQTKLLRVLQEMSFERVGSSQTVSVDVRILAATHQDLEALIRAGRFREDLYYRLNVISIRTPSLRERKEDIFELAIHFLNQFARRVGKAVTHLEESAIEALVAYDWPGNIRELENVLERAVVLSDGPAITLEDLPVEVRRPVRRRPRLVASPAVRSARRASSAWTDEPNGDPADGPLETLDAEVIAYERERLLDALQEAQGNKSEAARFLRMPRSTFFSKLKKHGLA